MSTFGRYFRGLTAYDLLGNLIPGLILLGGIYGFSHVSVQDVGVVAIGVSLIGAFVIGGFIQRHASVATGNRETFDLTIDSTTDLSTENESDDNKENKSDAGDTTDRSGLQEKVGLLAHRRYSRALLDPLVGWAGPPEGRELDDAVLTGSIRQHLVDAHGVSPDFDDFQVLYHLMISKVDSEAAPNRAVRIQALRNFYRGSWIAMWWFSGLIALSTLLVFCFEGSEFSKCFVLLGNSDICWKYNTPNVYQSWAEAWQLLVPAVFATLLANRSYESQAEDFVEYLFTDYAVAIESEQSELPTEFRHRVSRERTELDSNAEPNHDDSEGK
ncbi:hypothetical protein [Halobaculum sp. MBLA0143]|uniref:hypothetical protein n=1 Tax=Halobaculum sp. MBLA0143 TaxID=3079933 RepID=UPI003524F983